MQRIYKCFISAVVILGLTACGGSGDSSGGNHNHEHHGGNDDDKTGVILTLNKDSKNTLYPGDQATITILSKNLSMDSKCQLSIEKDDKKALQILKKTNRDMTISYEKPMYDEKKTVEVYCTSENVKSNSIIFSLMPKNTNSIISLKTYDIESRSEKDLHNKLVTYPGKNNYIQIKNISKTPITIKNIIGEHSNKPLTKPSKDNPFYTLADGQFEIHAKNEAGDYNSVDCVGARLRPNELCIIHYLVRPSNSLKKTAENTRSDQPYERIFDAHNSDTLHISAQTDDSQLINTQLNIEIDNDKLGFINVVPNITGTQGGFQYDIVYPKDMITNENKKLPVVFAFVGKGTGSRLNDEYHFSFKDKTGKDKPISQVKYRDIFLSTLVKLNENIAQKGVIVVTLEPKNIHPSAPAGVNLVHRIHKILTLLKKTDGVSQFTKYIFPENSSVFPHEFDKSIVTNILSHIDSNKIGLIGQSKGAIEITKLYSDYTDMQDDTSIKGIVPMSDVYYKQGFTYLDKIKAPILFMAEGDDKDHGYNVKKGYIEMRDKNEGGLAYLLESLKGKHIQASHTVNNNEVIADFFNSVFSTSQNSQFILDSACQNNVLKENYNFGNLKDYKNNAYQSSIFGEKIISCGKPRDKG